MGTVYLALDRKHGRRVAIKVLPPDLAAVLGPERFLREIRIAARLTHPHILPLHDSGEAGGILYYVMPYVEGESLADRLAREHQVPVAETLEIARQIADALGYAHGTGVVHRDVKPANILLAGYLPSAGAAVGGSHALLADFGVAKALADSTGPDGLTDSGLQPGTAGYASPEQAAGRTVDHRTDIYSLGCVLHEMLSGGGNRDLPEWLHRVLARATARDPADRFATADEFRHALIEPLGSRDAPPARHLRRRLAWMAAGGAAVALVGTAVAFLPRSTAGEDPMRVVVAGFENRTGDSALATIGDIASDYVARGLAVTRLLHGVYDTRSSALEAGQPVRVGAGAGRELAQRVNAGTVLWGSYYREGDSLHFEAQLIEAPTGKLLLSLEPAVGPAEERTRVVETLRQRVMAAFAVISGPEFEPWTAASVPPTYDAYREMLAGAAAARKYEFGDAIEHYRRAAILDSSFTGAQSAVALWLAYGRRCESVDSIARKLEQRERLLPPIDQAQVHWATAHCAKDLHSELEASRAALRASPRGLGFVVALLGVVTALESLRPQAALQVLEGFDPNRAYDRGDIPDRYTNWLAMTLHMLGDHQRELATARTRPGGAPGQSPGSADEAIALAALGKTDDAERLAQAWLDHPNPGAAFSAGELAECVALELRAHGHPEVAQRLLDKVVAWFGTDGINDAARADSFPCLWHHFSAFYYAGRWDEARAGYEALLRQDSSSLKAHAALGALAVRRGDPTEAARMERWLELHQSNPAASQAQARIAALLGERERAVTLLRRALDQELRGNLFLHLDPDFESLLDYPPYRELIRPKG